MKCGNALQADCMLRTKVERREILRSIMKAYNADNVLRIAASNWDDNLEPYGFACAQNDFTRRPECPKPGIQYDVLMFVLNHLNISYTIVPKNERVYNSCDHSVRMALSLSLISSLKVFGLCALDANIADFVVDLLTPDNKRVKEYGYSDVRSFGICVQRVITVQVILVDKLEAVVPLKARNNPLRNALLLSRAFSNALWALVLSFVLVLTVTRCILPYNFNLLRIGRHISTLLEQPQTQRFELSLEVRIIRED